MDRNKKGPGEIFPRANVRLGKTSTSTIVITKLGLELCILIIYSIISAYGTTSRSLVRS
jgi:hypothetical protein